jgi:hypothetical protein
MSFIDNPVVASLAAATGLNQVLGSAQSAAPPKSPQMRPEYQEARPPVNPRFAGPQAVPGGRAPITGVPGTEPGLMDAQTLQSPNVHDLLAHFGVTAPADINDHLFIHDPDAFAKHPMIASMIENGLGGLANYHTGQDTAGTLSNIAQSVIGNQAMHAQAYNNRAMMPLMQAQQIAALQDQVGKQSLQEAQQKHDNAMADYYTNLNTSREIIANTKAGAQTDVANINAGGRQATSPVAAFNNRVNTRLKARGYDNPADAPPDEVMMATKAQQQEDSLATHAAQIQIGAGHDATSRANASTRKGASGKLDQAQAQTDKELVGTAPTAKTPSGSGLKGLQAQYQYLDSLSKMPEGQRRSQAYLDGQNGKNPIDVPDASFDAIEAQKQALAQKAGSMHTQRAKLYASRGMTYTGIQPDAPAAAPAAVPATAPASGNPFRQ